MAGTDGDSEGAFLQPSRALRCETCNEVRKHHKHTIPSIWFPGPTEPKLHVSSELVLLYCSLMGFRQLQRKLDNEMVELCEMVNGLGAGMGGMDMPTFLQGLRGRICRIEELTKWMAALLSQNSLLRTTSTPSVVVPYGHLADSSQTHRLGGKSVSSKFIAVPSLQDNISWYNPGPYWYPNAGLNTI
ncbi:hypothetical protein BDN71DRAFT_1434572 [Pleurotus eryngii]|uniref:Uncharacterized protein n=1 Tax=Pleurotus eryngii TaxID=5323 RepID=A0A9P5ZQQ6_PLEER|nr:hypothetical protein BDN71DRAFT_1434572 [Pleurotus eryngii]